MECRIGEEVRILGGKALAELAGAAEEMEKRVNSG